VVGDVFGHDGAGADEGVAANGVAADDGAVGPQGGAALDEGGADLIHLSDFGAGVEDVGEDHGRAAEDAVFQGDTFVDGDVVLNFAFVADDGVWAYYDVLADVAVLADFGAGEDVGEVPDFGALADLDVVVDDGCFVGEKTRSLLKWCKISPYGRNDIFLDSRLRRYDRGGCGNDRRGCGNDAIFFLFEGVLAEFQDLEDAEAFFTGGEGWGAVLDGGQEGLAFGLQGLLPDWGDIDGSALRLVGYGQAVLPVDGVGVVNQLRFDGLCIVEDEHAAAAHDDELLFLVGIEPAHEDVGADARGELEVGHGDVGDPGVEEVAADGIEVGGLLAGEAQDEGDVVRGEGPEDVLLAADLAQGKAAGVDVLEAADNACADHLLQADDGGVVVQDVADEEGFLLLRGQADQGLAVGTGEGKGLFHEDVLAGVEGLGGEFVVDGGRGGDDDGGDCGIGQDVGRGGGDGDVRVGLGHVFADGLGAVADRFEDAKLVEIAHEVLAPVAGADDGDVLFSHKINPL